VDKSETFATVIVTSIVDVVKEFNKDPVSFKTNLDFATGLHNFEVMRLDINTAKTKKMGIA